MREEQGALFNTESLITVDQAMLDVLKERAYESPKRRFRLCLHQATCDDVQEMVIVLCHGVYLQPHRHPGCTSYQIVDGEMVVYVFSETGNVTNVIDLGDRASGKTFCFRLAAHQWYVPVVKTKYAIYHETLACPNQNGEATEYADWSPKPEDEDGVRAFLESLPSP